MSVFPLNNFEHTVWQNAIDLDLFTSNRDRGPEFIEAKTRFADQEGIETFYERPARLFRLARMDIEGTHPFLFSYNMSARWIQTAVSSPSPQASRAHVPLPGFFDIRIDAAMVRSYNALFRYPKII
jgi:hypothetical protein